MAGRGAILADNNIQQKIEKHLKHLFVHYIKSEDESGAIDYINNLSERYLENMPLLLNAMLFRMDLNKKTISTPLIYIAIIQNFSEFIKVIARLGADINFKIGYQDHTPVTLACTTNKVKSLSALLDVGAIINPKSNINSHLITYAAYPAILQKLIQHGSAHNALEVIFGSRVANDGFFRAACEKDEIEIITILLGNDFFRKNMSVRSILNNLHFAAWKSAINRSHYEKLSAELEKEMPCIIESDNDQVIKNDMINDLEYLLEHYIKNDDENSAIDYLNYLSSRYLDRLPQLLNLLNFGGDVASEKINVSLVYVASIFNFCKLIKKIKELGGDINLRVDAIDMNPLAYACIGNLQPAIITLLELGANITNRSNAGYKILFYVRQPALLRELTTYSLQHNLANEIFGDKKTNDALFRNACQSDETELIDALLEIPYYKSNLSVDEMLDSLRFAAWHHSKNRFIYEQGCRSLSSQLTRYTSPLCDMTENMTDKDDEDFRKSYISNNKSFFRLFLSNDQASKSYLAIRKNKTETLKSVLTQISAYMQQPKRCFTFLVQLEKELVRYITETHSTEPETLSADLLQECMINDVMYKLPKNTDYIRLKKNHALQEVIISIFKSRGLANKMYKWIGHVPGRFAKKMLQNGDFIAEDKMGVGLLHGKLSHMIHILLCIYILESDQVNTSYINDDGSESKLTIQDILDGLFFLHDESDNSRVTLFKAIFDRRTFNAVSFGDPHRLISFIMCHGDKTGCKVLSDYVSDSFIRGAIRLLAEHNHQREPDNQLSMLEFAEQLSQTKIHIFHNPIFVTKAAFKRAQDKYPVEKIVESGEGYKVIEKDYAWNQNFQPIRFKP